MTKYPKTKFKIENTKFIESPAGPFEINKSLFIRYKNAEEYLKKVKEEINKLINQ